MVFTVLKTPGHAKKTLHLLKRGRATPYEVHLVNWRQDIQDPQCGTERDQPEKLEESLKEILTGCMDWLEKPSMGIDIPLLVQTAYPVDQDSIAPPQATPRIVNPTAMGIILLLDDPDHIREASSKKARKEPRMVKSTGK